MSKIKNAATSVFEKSQFLCSKKYADNRDLMSVVLEDGRTYTTEQVNEIIENELKRKVI